MFVSFEGLDGSGKTTQVERLRVALEADGREVVTAREPGGTALGERIRELVLHGDEMTPWAEALLYAAARAELVAEVVEPALARGADVLLDRYLDSSVVYQGIARGLGLDEVLELNLLAVGGLLPGPDLRARDRSEPLARPARRRPRPDRARRARLPRARSPRGTSGWPRSSRSASCCSTAPSTPTRSRRGSTMSFAELPDQPEARRLLAAAVAEGPAHAYLLARARGCRQARGRSRLRRRAARRGAARRRRGRIPTSSCSKRSAR